MNASLNLNAYTERLINIKTVSPAQNKHPRWIKHKNSCSFRENFKTSSFLTTKKIEKVLSQLDKNFKKFDQADVDHTGAENLEKLIGLVQYNVQNYKSQHSRAYLFFSKIFFGDIDKISKKLIQHLETLRLRYPRPAPIELNDFAPIEADLEGRVKASRLKFYDLFSEQIQTPAPEEQEPKIRLPLINITSKGVSIRLPRELVTAGFDGWLKNLFNEKKVPFGEKPIVANYEGIILSKEFTLSLEDADKLLENIPNKGLQHLEKMIRQPELSLQHFHKHLPQENEPHVENTIAINLARLDPKLHQLLNGMNAHPQPQIPFSIPVVEFDNQGMTIKLAENDDHLKELLQQIFDFKGEPIEEVLYSRSYNHMFKIPRDDIPNVLVQLGLDKIPGDQLAARYNQGEISYLQRLVETKHYHAYQPVRTNDVIESIADSLAGIVSNENNITPEVSTHPRGWLSIRIPNGNEAYVENLTAYLKSPLIDLQEFKYKNYHELVIYEEMLPGFLKKLKLEKTPDQNSYLENLEGLVGQQPLEVLYAENDGNLDLRRTISRTLSALHPDLKEALKDFTPQDFPELQDIPLVNVLYVDDQLILKIPPVLNDKMMPIGPNQSLPFGRYLEHVFRLEPQMHLNNINELAVDEEGKIHKLIIIPKERIKSFLEKDLSLRLLPEKYQKKEIVIQEEENVNDGFNFDFDAFLGNFIRNRRIKKEIEAEKNQEENLRVNIVTFYNLYEKEQNIHHPHGAVADLSLRNPPIRMPQNIPQFNERTYLNNVKNILSGHKKKLTYVRVFEDTFRRIEQDNRRPNGVGATTRAYLNLIMHEIMTNKTIPVERKRAVLIDIGETCTACLPGRLGKIQDAYQYLVQPEFTDKVKCSLLNKVEQFKNGVLNELFKDNNQSVHYVASAKKEWGREFGLNDEEFDINHGGWNVQEGKKKKFEKICKTNLVNAVFDLVQNDRDEQGSLTNIGPYQSRIREILKEEGLKPDEIDAEIERLFPEEEVESPEGKKFIRGIKEEAVQMLLIDIKLLYS